MPHISVGEPGSPFFGPPASLAGGGGIGFTGYLPFLTQAAALATNLLSGLARKRAQERLVRLSDERIRLELEFAAQEEVHQVEILAHQEQVAFQKVFNLDNIDSQSYTEAAISAFGNAFDRREQLAQQREQFNKAKQFEAQDIREGNTPSSIALFSEAVIAANTGFNAGLSIADRIKNAQLAGDMGGLQNALVAQSFAAGESAIQSATLQRKLYQEQIREISDRLLLAPDTLAALAIGIPEKIRAGASPPISPGQFGQIFASNLRTISPRREAP